MSVTGTRMDALPMPVGTQSSETDVVAMYSQVLSPAYEQADVERVFNYLLSAHQKEQIDSLVHYLRVTEQQLDEILPCLMERLRACVRDDNQWSRVCQALEAIAKGVAQESGIEGQQWAQGRIESRCYKKELDRQVKEINEIAKGVLESELERLDISMHSEAFQKGARMRSPLGGMVFLGVRRCDII